MLQLCRTQMKKLFACSALALLALTLAVAPQKPAEAGAASGPFGSGPRSLAPYDGTINTIHVYPIRFRGGERADVTVATGGGDGASVQALLGVLDSTYNLVDYSIGDAPEVIWEPTATETFYIGVVNLGSHEIVYSLSTN